MAAHIRPLNFGTYSGLRDASKLSRPIPNFFIVGAARSGTTSLWSYLSSHPDIYMSYQKEPAFFGSDLTKTPNEFAVLEREAYLDLFKDSGNKVIRGESSVLYLISKNAAQEIYDFNPSAKILIILRNPVDMLHSYHGQMHWIGHEEIADFEEALAAEAARREGRLIPKTAMVPEALHYSEIARFSVQVERYLNVFPRNQVQIMLYDDLVKSPQKAYESVEDFLGVPRVAPSNYDTKNAYKKPRSIAFAGLVQRPPRAVRFFLDFLSPKTRHVMLVGMLLALNTRRAKKEAMSLTLRRKLTEYFADDIGRLSLLLHRDLSKWLTVSEPLATPVVAQTEVVSAAELGGLRTVATY